MDINWKAAPFGATHVGDYDGDLEFYRPADNEKGGEYYDAGEGTWEILVDSFESLVRNSYVYAKENNDAEA